MRVKFWTFVSHIWAFLACARAYADKRPNIVDQLRTDEFSYASKHQLAPSESVALSFERPSSQNLHEIPKIIWTYWNDDNLPEFIDRCIANWRFFNPEYQIHVVTRANLDRYINSEPPKHFHKSSYTPQYQSDWVRLELLVRYGGIWMDASAVLLGPLEWVHRHQKFENRDGVIFYVDPLTSDYSKPVVENWFIASVPAAPFIQRWRQVYSWALDRFNNGYEYVQYLRQVHGKQPIDNMLQGMNTKGLSHYLMQHVAALKVMFIDNIDMKFVLLRAEDGPMHLQGSMEVLPWRLFSYARKWTRLPITEWKELTELQVPMIKLVGNHRKALLYQAEHDRAIGAIHPESLYAQLIDEIPSVTYYTPISWRRRWASFKTHLLHFSSWIHF